MTINDYPDRELMMLSLADRIAGQLADFLRREGRATLCVPGGTTPGPVFDMLSGVDLDWANVSVILTDERCVPADSPRSNARLLRERLLRGRAAAARFVPLPDPQAGRDGDDTAALLALLPISVLLLGMGDDTHVASLFPDDPDLPAAMAPGAPPVLHVAPPSQPEARLTLTLPVLQKAVQAHLLIAGADKRAALERARGLSAQLSPLRALLDEIEVHWAE